MSDLVLVSGGSGFMAAHIIVQLVAAGYRVRTTVRSAGRAAVVRDMLIDLIRRLVAGQMPACPDLWFGVVDVRDAAGLHLLVMASPEAAGERFICTQGGAVSMLAIARELKARLGTRGVRVPTRRLPNLVVRAIGVVNPEMKSLIPLLGKARSATSAKAVRRFGWQPRAWEDAVLASAESLFELGVIEAR